MVDILKKVDEIVAKNDVGKDDSVVTIKHNVVVENNQQLIDAEMMIPLNKEIVVAN